MTALNSSPSLAGIAEIILDLHAAGADNDWTCDDLLDILRREDPALCRQTLAQMAKGQPKPLRQVA